jgi:hypothetical protein
MVIIARRPPRAWRPPGASRRCRRCRVVPGGHLSGCADADHGLQPGGQGPQRPDVEEAFLRRSASATRVSPATGPVRPSAAGLRHVSRGPLVSARGPAWNWFRCRTRCADSMSRCWPSSFSGRCWDHRSAPRHAHRFRRRHARPQGARTAGEQRRDGGRLRHVSDADGRPDGGCRRRQVMPPKSTWFEPKLADGLVSLLLDRLGLFPGS